MRCVNQVAAKISLWVMLLCASSTSVAEAELNVWTSNGPGGGNVLSLAIDPSTTATVYAGTFGGGVFKSANGGGSWSAVNTGLTDVRALAIDPVTPSTLYAGTHDTGVFKSTDGGASWSTANTGLPYPFVLALVIDPLTPNTLYAGTSGFGVFKSTNGGGSWSAARTGLPLGCVVESLAIDPLTPSTLYAGTGSNGVFKSTNGGQSWSVVKPATPAVRTLAIDPLAPTTVYAGTAGGGKVFKSTNGGGTWSTANTGLPIGSIVEALAIDPLTSTTIYVGTAGSGVFKSTDGGGSWAPFNAGLTNLFVGALQISLSGACVHAATESGVFDLAIRSDPCSGSAWLGLNANQGVFVTGDTLHLDVTFANPGPAQTVDVYFGVLLPPEAGPAFGCPQGGAIVFMADNFARFVTTCLSAPQDFAPFAANLPIAASIPSALLEDFFSLTWPPDAPGGPYTFFLGLTSAGTLDIITLAETTISFTP